MEIDLLRKQGHVVVEHMADSREIENAWAAKTAAGLRMLYSRRRINEIRTLIDLEKPDVVHVHNVFPLLTPSIYIGIDESSVPLVQAVRNYRFLCPNGLFYTQGEVCHRCVEGQLINAIRFRCLHGDLVQSTIYAASIQLHRIIGTIPSKLGVLAALSPYVASQLEKYFRSVDKVYVLPNFINASNIPIGNLTGNYAVYLGRLSPEKGVVSLVEAMQDISDVKLKVIGSGPSETQLKSMIQENGMQNVELMGYINGPERFDIVRKAFCLIVPSQWHEPFGRVVLEAYACGVPVIAARMGGLQDLVIEEQTGLLYQTGDVHELTRSIKYLAENRKKAIVMGRRGRSLVEEHYSPESHYHKLMEIYQQAQELQRT
jgi:glycosyltransferase involved in cell wall biosynthesis